MTRSELNRMKEALAKGMILDGIIVDERPDANSDTRTLTPVVLSATHIGWEFIDDSQTSDEE